MSQPRCIVLDSRITSRPDPASFGPPAGIRIPRDPHPRRDWRTASRTNGQVAAGAGPEREESRRGFRGLVMSFAGFGRCGEAGL